MSKVSSNFTSILKELALILKNTCKISLLPLLFFAILILPSVFYFSVFFEVILLLVIYIPVFVSLFEHNYKSLIIYVVLSLLLYYFNIIDLYFLYFLIFLIFIPSYALSFLTIYNKRIVSNSSILLILSSYISIFFIMITNYYGTKLNIPVSSNLYDYIYFLLLSLNSPEYPIKLGFIPEYLVIFVPFIMLFMWVLIVWANYSTSIKYLEKNKGIFFDTCNKSFSSKYYNYIIIIFAITTFLAHKLLANYPNVVYSLYISFLVMCGFYIIIGIIYLTRNRPQKILIIIWLTLGILLLPGMIVVAGLFVVGFIVSMNSLE